MSKGVKSGRSNLVSQARSTLHIFGAMMRREWWGLPTTQAAFEQALQRRVKLHLMLCQYPGQVTLYLVGVEHQRFVYDAQTGVWRITAFIVVDRRHAFLAEQPESRTALNTGGMEYMNAEEVAYPLMATFDRLADSRVTVHVNPSEFLTAARTAGLQLQRWSTDPLLDSGQWVGLTAEEVAAYERELAPVAA